MWWPRVLVAVPAVVTAVLGTAAPADAAWGGTGTGSAAGRAVVMPAGQKPTASVTGSDVTLRWSAAVLPGGTPVAGYRLTRYDGNGNPVTVLAACSGTVASTTCTEHNVPSGTWTYTDTPAQDSWSGAPSPPSAAVVVAATG